MRANPTSQKTANTTRQLGEGTYQATKKLTIMSNFYSLGHRNRGNQNRTVSPNMWPSHLFSEQSVSSPLLNKEKKFQKRSLKMDNVIGTSWPMQGMEKRSKSKQNTNTLRPGSNISTRNTTTINLDPGPTKEAGGLGKDARSTISLISILRASADHPDPELGDQEQYHLSHRD